MTAYLAFLAIAALLAIFPVPRVVGTLFLALTFIFVGLRFETGFDWPNYKDGFELLSQHATLADAAWYSSFYEIEIGYAALVVLAGWVFPEYEFLQAAITLLLLWSMVSLCSAFGIRNVAMAVALASTFLLFTLMFSTTRQCLAVAIFNFALIGAFRQQWVRFVILSLVALSIHQSVAFYVLAALFASGRPMQVPKLHSVAMIALVGGALVMSLSFIAPYLPSYAASRIYYYGLDQALAAISMWQIYFLLFSIMMIALAMFGAQTSAVGAARTIFLRRMIIALGVLCVCTFSLNVVRDRISYELFLLFAVFLARDGIQLPKAARGLTVALALTFSMLNIFSPANRVVFTPYQNVLVVAVTGDNGDGRARQAAFAQDFEGTHTE